MSIAIESAVYYNNIKWYNLQVKFVFFLFIIFRRYI